MWLALPLLHALALGTGPVRLALPSGPRAVGFRVLQAADPSRSGPQGAPRPVQIGLWYPSTRGGLSLGYRDYVMATAGEATLGAVDPSATAEAVSRHRAFLAGNGVPAPGIDAWMNASMRAAPHPLAARGRYPVVLLAGGMGGALPDQAALAEHLASHGYLVATTPSPVRLGARMESEADVLPLALEQQRDLEIALREARAQPMADPRRLALVGYSFGARPALLLAAAHPEAAALVSLDGGIGAEAAKGWLDAAALDRGALRLPLLHLWQDGDPAVRPDFALIESLARAPRTLVRMEGLRHLDLTTYGLARARLPALGEADAAALDARVQTAAALTTAFLDARVKGQAGAWNAALAHAPPGLLTVRVLAPAPRAR